jgi:hypothetical protein
VLHGNNVADLAEFTDIHRAPPLIYSIQTNRPENEAADKAYRKCYKKSYIYNTVDRGNDG